MASNFLLTVNAIIEKALKRINVIGEGEEMTSEMYNSAFQDLQLINVGLNRYRKKLWTIDTVTFPLSESSCKTNDGKTYRCIVDHTSDADNEPGTGDNWTNYWVVGQTTEESPDAWALDTDYTSGATKELEANVLAVDKAFIRDIDYDTGVEIINRFSKAEIVEKGNTGLPEYVYFDRYASPPTIALRPIPDSSNYVLHIETIRMLNDIGAQGSSPDVPAEWQDFLIYALAYKQGLEYGASIDILRLLKSEAAVQLQMNIKDQAERSDTVFCSPTY